jgi:hypothetical protein
MLRITTLHDDGRIVLKLEGRLAGPWVEEVDACWRAVAAAGDRPIDVDLRDVLLVDAAGEAELARMHRAGARLLARGCCMRELVREIDGHR